MVRPVINKPIEKSGAVRNRKKRVTPLIGKRLIRSYLTANGAKHRITPSAFNTMSFVGKGLIEKIVLKIKTELSSGNKSASPKSISSGHIIHAANAICVPAEITEDAKAMMDQERYDKSAFKRSNVHRLIQNYCGKNRVKKNTTTFLWCVVVSIMQEVIHQATLQTGEGEKKNIRVRNENIVGF